MFENFFSALALVMVLEGLLPFAFPHAWKKLMIRMLTLSEVNLRITGLVSMIVGLLMLSLVQSFVE